MNRSPRFAQSKLLVHQALVLALSIPLAGASIADTTLVCSEIGDSDRTRAVVEIGSSVSQLEIVTPEHAWSDPDVPEEETNVSPNLVGREEVYVSSVKDSKDQLRIIDFGVLFLVLRRDWKSGLGYGAPVRADRGAVIATENSRNRGSNAGSRQNVGGSPTAQAVTPCSFSCCRAQKDRKGRQIK
jgi:hypothetical protein